MDDKVGFVITSRDRVLRAWQNSTELVRDYQQCAHGFEQSEGALIKMFSEFAEDEARHAAKLLELLKRYEQAGER